MDKLKKFLQLKNKLEYWFDYEPTTITAYLVITFLSVYISVSYDVKLLVLLLEPIIFLLATLLVASQIQKYWETKEDIRSYMRTSLVMAIFFMLFSCIVIFFSNQYTSLGGTAGLLIYIMMFFTLISIITWSSDQMDNLHLFWWGVLIAIANAIIFYTSYRIILLTF